MREVFGLPYLDHFPVSAFLSSLWPSLPPLLPPVVLYLTVIDDVAEVDLPPSLPLLFNPAPTALAATAPPSSVSPPSHGPPKGRLDGQASKPQLKEGPEANHQ